MLHKTIVSQSRENVCTLRTDPDSLLPGDAGGWLVYKPGADAILIGMVGRGCGA